MVVSLNYLHNREDKERKRREEIDIIHSFEVCTDCRVWKRRLDWLNDDGRR